ncbi:MAG: sugar ABC transporter permease [Clostridia bacterium]|nr:sugar ABC transporter permease [Clostridia bacterium]MDY5264664.1 sugar ABC transporter permease [Eubacteriales bacterium]MDY5439399.1 sugar ABC transporter permease [Eubacteriales bacterium]
MEEKTTGKVIAVKKQYWLKVNTKPIRTGVFDGATFPCIIKVSYVVDGKTYVKRKWVDAWNIVPSVDSVVMVSYCKDKPKKANILF